MAWDKIKEWMEAHEFDAAMIAKGEGATTPEELIEKLDDWDGFSWLMMSIASSSWKPLYLKAAMVMANKVRYLMSKDAARILDDLRDATPIRLSDPQFLRRIRVRADAIFEEASAKSTKVAKALVREFDQKKFEAKNLEFCKALSDQIMQLAAHLACNPSLPARLFWFNLTMQTEMLDRLMRCMNKEPIAESILREMARKAFAATAPTPLSRPPVP
jgi:hypothetical protein